MQDFTVVYLKTFGEPLAFFCRAEDSDHAEEQFLDAHKGSEAVWISEGCDAEQAFYNWWNAI